MKVKISKGELGTVITLTAENEADAEALKDLWCNKGALSSFWEEGSSPSAGDELEIATETK